MLPLLPEENLTYRRRMTQAATMVYAMRVPMLIMSTRCFKSNTVAIRPENIPDRTVATRGVCVEWFTRDKNLGMRPSEAIAYSTLRPNLIKKTLSLSFD